MLVHVSQLKIGIALQRYYSVGKRPAGLERLKIFNSKSSFLQLVNGNKFSLFLGQLFTLIYTLEIFIHKTLPEKLL